MSDVQTAPTTLACSRCGKAIAKLSPIAALASLDDELCKTDARLADFAATWEDALADIANTCEDVADGGGYESERAGDAVLHVAKRQRDLDDEEPRDPSPQGVLEKACRIAMEAYQAEGLVQL